VAVRGQPAGRRPLRHAGHRGRRGHLRRLPGLPHVTAPTLLVAGDRDRFYSPELFRETAERIPGARLLLYPGKGHAGVLTHRPANREIVAFLTADDRPGT
jgi:pimeloyl-ACP methyl ester carboxylesterase